MSAIPSESGHHDFARVRSTWRRFAARGVALWILAFALAPTADVSAQDTPLLATLTARAWSDLPLGPEIEIRYLEDTEINLRLRDLVAELLRQRGIGVAEHADLVLAFDSSIVSDAAKETRLELSGAGGERGGQEFQLNLVMPTARTNARPTEKRYRVKMTLFRAGEPPLWVGLAAAQRGNDRFAITRALITALVERIGKTVDQETILVR